MHKMKYNKVKNYTLEKIFSAFLLMSTSLFFLEYVSCSENPSQNNIAFDLPNITSIVYTDFGESQLEAYKATSNDHIFDSKDPTLTSQLLWVSLGIPTIVKTYRTLSSYTTELFHTSSTGFYTYVQMLTPQLRTILANRASESYGISINEKQIVNLILSKFTCEWAAYSDGKRLTYKGEVTNFKNFPLRMDFFVVEGSSEWKYFTKNIEHYRGTKASDIVLECELATFGKHIKTNSLTIKQTQSEFSELMDKLFGPTESRQNNVFVTRQQLNNLASDLYMTLDIVENYEMPEHEFNSQFVNKIIEYAASTTFKEVPFAEVIQSLSRYTIDFGKDLTPDQLSKEISNLFSIETKGNKSHIVINKEKEQSAQNEYAGGGKSKLAVDTFWIAGSLEVEANVNTINNWQNKDISLDNQLHELNSMTENEVQWKMEGNKVVPKSINVVKFSSGKFNKTIIFTRIKKHTYDILFHKKYSLYTIQSSEFKNLKYSIQRNYTDIDGNNTTNDLIEKYSDVENQISDYLRSPRMQKQIDNMVNQSFTKNYNQMQRQINAIEKNNFQFNKTGNNSDIQKVPQFSDTGIRGCRLCFQTRHAITAGQLTDNHCGEWTYLTMNDKSIGSSKIMDITDSTFPYLYFRLDCE